MRRAIAILVTLSLALAPTFSFPRVEPAHSWPPTLLCDPFPHDHDCQKYT